MATCLIKPTVSTFPPPILFFKKYSLPLATTARAADVIIFRARAAAGAARAREDISRGPCDRSAGIWPPRSATFSRTQAIDASTYTIRSSSLELVML
jgi:hypothetical protein